MLNTRQVKHTYIKLQNAKFLRRSLINRFLSFPHVSSQVFTTFHSICSILKASTCNQQEKWSWSSSQTFYNIYLELCAWSDRNMVMLFLLALGELANSQLPGKKVLDFLTEISFFRQWLNPSFGELWLKYEIICIALSKWLRYTFYYYLNITIFRDAIIHKLSEIFFKILHKELHLRKIL